MAESYVCLELNSIMVWHSIKYGLESWIGVLEWSFGVLEWRFVVLEWSVGVEFDN